MSKPTHGVVLVEYGAPIHSKHEEAAKEDVEKGGKKCLIVLLWVCNIEEEDKVSSCMPQSYHNEPECPSHTIPSLSAPVIP